jgi:hypothetical protein
VAQHIGGGVKRVAIRALRTQQREDVGHRKFPRCANAFQDRTYMTYTTYESGSFFNPALRLPVR